MRIFLVGKTPHSHRRIGLAIEKDTPNGAGCPVAAMTAILQARRDDAGIRSICGRQPAYCGQVTFQVAAANPQPWLQVRILADAAVKLEGGYDLRPIGANRFAQFSERVGHTDRSDETAVD